MARCDGTHVPHHRALRVDKLTLAALEARSVAGFFADMFYPTLLLRLFLPVHVVWTWTFVLHHFLAGLGRFYPDQRRYGFSLFFPAIAE